jgi:hypothetical protein
MRITFTSSCYAANLGYSYTDPIIQNYPCKIVAKDGSADAINTEKMKCDLNTQSSEPYLQINGVKSSIFNLNSVIEIEIPRIKLGGPIGSFYP